MSHYSWPPLTNVVPDQLLLMIFFLNCVCVHVWTLLCVCMWSPEANIKYLPSLSSTLFVETVSVTEPGTPRFSQTS